MKAYGNWIFGYYACWFLALMFLKYIFSLLWGGICESNFKIERVKKIRCYDIDCSCQMQLWALVNTETPWCLFFLDQLIFSTSRWQFSSSSSATLHFVFHLYMGRVSVTPLSVICCFSLYVSLMDFICCHISTTILHVLVSWLFLELIDSQFFLLYHGSLLSPFVYQAICLSVWLFFLYLVLLQFISRYCFPFIPHTVVAIITFYTTSHSCHRW